MKRRHCSLHTHTLSHSKDSRADVTSGEMARLKFSRWAWQARRSNASKIYKKNRQGKNHDGMNFIISNLAIHNGKLVQGRILNYPGPNL